MKFSYGVVMSLLATGAVLAAACSDDEGTETDPGTGGTSSTTSTSGSNSTTDYTSSSSSTSTSADCGGLQYSDDVDCQGCLEASCCAELVACDAGTDCGSLWDCLLACDDDPCMEQCFVDYDAGLTPLQDLIGCKDDSCLDSCVPPGALCGTELSYPSAVMTQCVTDHCCATYDPCYADPACNACLQDPDGQGCDANQLLADYLACKEAQCPTAMCDTDVGYWSGDDPMIACNICGDTHCCAHLTVCVGDGSPGATAQCIDCINGEPSCTDQTTLDAATAFTACLQSDCSGDC